MGLTAAEEKELAMLEAAEAAKAQNPASAVPTSNLTPEEEKELATLEAQLNPKKMGIGEGLARTAINSLPIAGGVLGGASSLLGGPTAPLTVAALAGGGAMAGESLKRGLNAYLFDDEEKKLAKEMKNKNLIERLGQSFVQPGKAGLDAMTSEMGGPLIAKGLNAGVKAVTPAISKQANKFMADALGLERGTSKKLMKDYGPDAVNRVSEYAFKNKLVNPLSSAEEILENNQAVKDALLSQRKTYFQTIDDAGASTYNAAKTTEEFQKAFPKPPDYLSNKSTQEAYDKVVTDMMSAGNKPSAISKADELRQIFGSEGKFEAAKASPAASVYQRGYGKLAEMIDEAGIASAKGAGIDPMSVGALNKDISTGIGVDNLARNAVAKKANKAIGLTDSIFLAPQIAAGNFGAAAATLGIKEGVERYGNQNMALGLDALTKAKFTEQGQKILPYLLMMNQKEKGN